MLELFF
jgi:hypothetical protein